LADSGKTEKATQKKRQDERKKGNVFQSKDVSSALGLLVITFLLKLVISPALGFINSIITNSFNDISDITELTVQSIATLIAQYTIKALILIISFGLAAALIAVALSGAQTRFIFSAKKLKPQFSRINPVTGFQKILSLRSLVELIKSLVKIIIISAVLYTQIKASTNTVLKLPLLSTVEAMGWVGDTIYNIVMNISMYMALFAIADYLYQWWEHEKELRMTKREIKDEYKQTEGDPQIKSKIKDVQRKMAAMRMMKKVPTADVVIKNPTHFAVALRYKPPKDKAPIVIAKGMDYLALKIIEIAEQNGIEITENRPLARGLYESVELDRPIPDEFYKPVADILAFIYKLKQKKNKKNKKG